MTLLLEIRKRAGMSASELARKIDVLPSSIYGYEQGHCLPRAETQAKIAAVFGVKPSTIFNGLPRLGRKKGSHARYPRCRPGQRIQPDRAKCIWCGHYLVDDIRMIGAGEDIRRYCSVHCLGEYLWTREKNKTINI